MNIKDQGNSQAYLLTKSEQPKNASLNPDSNTFILGIPYFTTPAAKPMLQRSIADRPARPKPKQIHFSDYEPSDTFRARASAVPTTGVQLLPGAISQGMTDARQSTGASTNPVIHHARRLSGKGKSQDIELLLQAVISNANKKTDDRLSDEDLLQCKQYLADIYTKANRKKEAELLKIIKSNQTPNTQQEGTKKEIQPTFRDIDFDLLRLWIKMEKYDEAIMFLRKIYLYHNHNYEKYSFDRLTPEEKNQIRRRIDNIKEIIQLLMEKGFNKTKIFPSPSPDIS